MADNFYGNTDVGKMRSNNEDTFVVQQIDGGKVLACVIDGVGGYEGGEVAAQIAKETLLRFFEKKNADAAGTLKAAFLAANERIYHGKVKTSEHEKMACVVTAAVVDMNANQLHFAHVGDTRLYLFRDGSLVKLTRDHSFVGYLEDTKRLSEEEAMRHPKRNEINKALGFDPQMAEKDDYMDFSSSPFLPGDTILLCSDGLSDLVSSADMISIMSGKKSLKQKTDALVAAANERGGKDNITVVLVQNTKKAPTYKATAPVKKNEVPEETVADEPVVVKSAPAEKKPSAAVPLLLFLLIAALAVIGWMWWQQREHPAKNTVVIRQQNTAEIALQNLISSAQGYLQLGDTVNTAQVLVTDTIVVRQDSLHINGGGMVLRADSMFRGPALDGRDARFLMLENIVFENFHTAIIAGARAIQLRNVKFINCRYPVLTTVRVPVDTSVSGYFMDTLLPMDTSRKIELHR